MTKEVIEKYIQFGINNGYKLKIQTLGNKEGEDAFIGKIYSMHCIELVSTNIKSLVSDRSLIDICTSKEFIEAVARGIIWKQNTENHKHFKKEDLVNYDFSEKINKITIEQAIAIRDGKLEEFILELIK